MNIMYITCIVTSQYSAMLDENSSTDIKTIVNAMELYLMT